MSFANAIHIAVVIQARSGSERLPGKVLKPFYQGKTLLGILIEKLKTFNNLPVIIATTDNPGDDKIIDLAKFHNINYFRGSEEDVLGRFLLCADHYNIENIIRVCSDNPFIDIPSLINLKESFLKAPVDYLSYMIGGKPSIVTHFGFWAEIVSFNALKKIALKVNDIMYREHVTNYIYQHPTDFTVRFLDVPDYISGRKDIRLTVDTEEDFVMAAEIYSKLVKSKPNFGLSDIIHFIDENPNYLKAMKSSIRKNSK